MYNTCMSYNSVIHWTWVFWSENTWDCRTIWPFIIPFLAEEGSLRSLPVTVFTITGTCWTARVRWASLLCCSFKFMFLPLHHLLKAPFSCSWWFTARGVFVWICGKRSLLLLTVSRQTSVSFIDLNSLTSCLSIWSSVWVTSLCWVS